MTAMFTVRCDYREDRGGCVITRLRECRAAGMFVPPDQYEIVDEVLTTGDYVIQAGAWIIIIERKTWDDLSASIKDGRIFANHKKMIEARNHGVRIMYLIEGRAPSPEWSAQKVGGILVGNMVAKLDHFAMRDNVWVDYTRDARHTAARLIELGKHMSTLLAPDVPKDGPIAGGAAAIDIDAIVKKKHERPIAEVRRQMLMCVPGIGEKTAAALLDDYKWGDITSLRDIKGIATRPLAELRELISGNRPAIYIAMLASIKGVSEKMATLIAAAVSISRITARDPTITSVIADIKIGDAGRRLGDKLAETVVAHFSDADDAAKVENKTG